MTFSGTVTIKKVALVLTLGAIPEQARQTAGHQNVHGIMRDREKR